jgi:Cysteine rich repeat
MFRKVTLLVASLIGYLGPVLAQPLPLPLPFPPLPMPQGTPEERAACAPDVKKYCEAALPDTMRVLSCLQANRTRISGACNRVLVSHGQ